MKESVLFSEDLFRTITSFQSGSVQDLVSYSRRWNQLKERRNLGLWSIYFNIRLDSEGTNQHHILYLTKKFYPERFTARFLDVAAERGSLDIIKFATPQSPCTTAAMDLAAEAGNLEIVQYIHENRTEKCTTHAMDQAACNGHLEIVKYLHEHRTEGCTTDAIDGAASHGHLDIVQFLHQNRQEGYTHHAIEFAAHSGHFNVVAYFLELERARDVPGTSGECQFGMGSDLETSTRLQLCVSTPEIPRANISIARRAPPLVRRPSALSMLD